MSCPCSLTPFRRCRRTLSRRLCAMPVEVLPPAFPARARRISKFCRSARTLSSFWRMLLPGLRPRAPGFCNSGRIGADDGTTQACGRRARIAAGDVFRRLVSRALAHLWALVFDAATRHAPLPARASCPGRVRRPGWPSARSVGATILRASFFTALRDVAPDLLPFVRLFYGQPSTYCWWDCHGHCREFRQGEGCEQGDPLAPALFSLGQHGGLLTAASRLQPRERLLACVPAQRVMWSSRPSRLTVA